WVSCAVKERLPNPTNKRVKYTYKLLLFFMFLFFKLLLVYNVILINNATCYNCFFICAMNFFKNLLLSHEPIFRRKYRTLPESKNCQPKAEFFALDKLLLD